MNTFRISEGSVVKLSVYVNYFMHILFTGQFCGIRMIGYDTEWPHA